jgi:8-oxo-dGTP pyrophosphatase MutT (NUDIX family)
LTLQPWEHREERLLADARIFQVRQVRTRSPRTGEDRSIAVVTTGDWINVIALTPDQQVVLVRQFRHGTRTFTLEIPGGLIDPGETPVEAAVRELREETGYVGKAPLPLGVVDPNPAFLDNRCFTVLLENCQRAGELQQDGGEDIEVELRPLAAIPAAIAAGEISHALVVAGFWWLAQARPDQFRPGR